MKFAIIVFPGSNCDHDAYKVIENIDGATPEFVWHKENDLSNSTLLLFQVVFHMVIILELELLQNFLRL